MRDNFVPIRMESQKDWQRKALLRIWRKWDSTRCSWEWKNIQALENIVLKILQKLNIHLLYDLVIPLIESYPRERNAHAHATSYLLLCNVTTNLHSTLFIISPFLWVWSLAVA